MLEDMQHLEKGPHYALIKNTAPGWLTQASLSRVHRLNERVMHRPPWYAATSELHHATLKALNADAWRLQNTVDKHLEHVQDVYAFAEPLLKRAIKDQYGLDLDVNTTFLQIYTPKKLPWYAIDFSNGVTSRKVSLLDAALHNFAQRETFEKHSCYITQPDYRGHFSILAHERTMSLEQFKTLCRRLDLGSLYQRHLNLHLLPTEPVAQAFLSTRVIASQKAALRAAAYMALLKNDVGPAAYAVLTGVLDGTEKRARFYQLSVLDTPLSGILLIAQDLERVTSASKMIAYIPHDPESPVKEYASGAAFMLDLTRKLQLNNALPSSTQTPRSTYQQFFSQFVPHSQRGVFFAALSERLYKLQWHKRDPLDPAPSWCEVPASRPVLQLKGTLMIGDPWQRRYQSAINQILNDGRSLAVATAQADSNERLAWWENVLKISSDLLNAALFVVTPFVPLLGELMLAYTLYQLTDDVLEGIVDLSEGQATEAAQHFIGVVTDVVQLGALAAGSLLAKEVLFKPSPFVDSLKAVQVDGKPRLWNPDLAPYARKDLQLPAEARPDALGLHAHQGHTVLHLENTPFVVEYDAPTHTHRVKHPNRHAAYRPLIEPNGSGAWVHEGEDPWTWDDRQLRGRLGPVTQGLSADEVGQACTISGTDAGALRNMYLRLDPTPPLLADSLSRFKFYRQASQLPDTVRSGGAHADWFTWPAQLITERASWPPEKAIKVLDADDCAMTFGAIDADDAHTLTIRLADVQAGKLEAQVAQFLTEEQLQTMLPPPLPDTTDARIAALRNLSADELEHDKIATFNHLYSTREVCDTLPGRLLLQAFPQLPAELVSPLMLRVSARELTVMRDEQRIPLRLKNLARGLQNESIASHALEGFYNDALLSADTERMVLNILRLYTDALGELQISVRERVPSGAMRCKAGAVGATSKTLLRKENGRYQIHDPGSPGAQPQYTFFEALLRVLPGEKIGYVPGQGRVFKAWLREKLEPPTERVTVLAPSAVRQVDQREIQRLLQKPMFGAFRRLFRGEPAPATPEQRLRTLCPLLSDAQAQSILPTLEHRAGKSLLSTLEHHKAQLLENLERWKKKPTVEARHHLASANESLMRLHVINELRSNWEAAAPGRLSEAAYNPDSTSLDLSETTLGRYIRSLELPAGSFNHVTHLNLSRTRLGDADSGFLKSFPSVRELNLVDNQLTRVPVELSATTQLRVLILQDNPITWSLTDYQTLTQCPQLRWLDLQGHTDLQVPPDLTSLPNLEYLNMHSSGINRWPVGLDTPRASITELNMINTRVHNVPEVGQSSQAAQLIARSWLDRSKLEPADEARFVAYRRSAGIDPYRTAPGRGAFDSAFWLSNLSDQARPQAQQMWDELEHEHGSQGFFDVLRLLLPSEDFETDLDEYRYTQGTHDLISRVQQLLIAVDRDPHLRERMFNLAATPALCADAGAQIFNRMGIELLEADIFADQTPAGLAARESRLVTLARQKWRLERLNEKVREDIRRRTAPHDEGGLAQAFGSAENEVDEVEVYLAYQTGLKQRLDLPWLSQYMIYRETANVSQLQLDSAYRQIFNLEYGNGLIDGLLQQDFWSDYLEETYRVQFDTRREQRAQAGSQLDDLIEAQQQWLAAEETSVRKAQLRKQLTDLADALVIPYDEVLSEQTLSQATIKRFYEHIQHDYKELGRKLTRQALTKAGL